MRPTRAVTGAERAVAKVAAPDESHLRIELVPDDEVVRAASKKVGVVDQPRPVALVVAFKPGRVRARVVADEVDFVVEPELAVDAPGAVRLAGGRDGRRSAFEQRAHVAPAEQIAFEPRDGEVRRHRAGGFILVRLDAEQADVERPDLSREAPTREHLHGSSIPNSPSSTRVVTRPAPSSM